MNKPNLEKLPRNSSKRPRIAFVFNAFPMLSETFIVNEVRFLLDHDFDILLLSLFDATQNMKNPEAEDMAKKTIYLSSVQSPMNIISSHLFFILRRPLRYFSTFIFAFRKRNIRSPLKLFKSLVKVIIYGGKKSSKKERQNVLLHFLLVPLFAKIVLRKQLDLIHAHFADAATSFALLMSRLTDVPYSFTTHAMDVFVPQELIRDKLAGAKFIITCTGYNKKYLCDHYRDIDCAKINKVYHGLNYKYFSPDGKKRNDQPPILLAIGRMVRKKGIGVLIKACSLLQDKRIDFRCWIVGDGPERACWELDSRIKQLSGVITFHGSIPPSRIKEFYKQAAVFALPCIVDENGDRDGIPNVIAEAMAMQLPVVSSNISGIPELVIDGENGFLLEPNDYIGLASKLERLLTTAPLRQKMGKSGRQRIIDVFDADNCLTELADVFVSNVAH